MNVPCNECPFRKNHHGFLRADRATEIAETVLHDGFFICHKTVDYDEEEISADRMVPTERHQFCSGAAHFLDNIGVGAMANVCARLEAMTGRMDPEKMKSHAEVFGSIEEMVEHHEAR